jgi:hypothetical protein
VDSKVFLSSLSAEVGSVVKTLIAASAKVEDDAYIYGIGGWGGGGAGGVDKEEGDVGHEEGDHEDEELPHDRGKVNRGWVGGKGEEASPYSFWRLSVRLSSRTSEKA